MPEYVSEKAIRVLLFLRFTDKCYKHITKIK